MSKVFYTQNNYTVNSAVLVNRHSNDVISRDSGVMKVKVRAGRDAWDLKVNCEASLIADTINLKPLNRYGRKRK